MPERFARSAIAWVLAMTLAVAPFIGNRIEAQAQPGTPAASIARTPEPRVSPSTGPHSARPETHGRLHIADMTTGATPQQLADLLLSGQGVTISNVMYAGSPIAAGIFTGGTASIGIESGIILGSGRVADAVGPNTSDNRSTALETPGDSSLNAILGAALTADATVLEFDFVPQGGTLSFQYVFASEEYNEFVGSIFNDVFAFFVNGQNVALIPGTNIPVSINNVNQGNPNRNHPPTNAQFYRNNDLQDGGGSIDTEMDGLTVVLTVQANVNPGVTNHIKLAIADVGDTAYDSNVFIKAGSFTSGCASMRLSPQFPSEPLGATFQVAILIEAACEADAAEAHLNFDPTRLQVIDATTDVPGVQIVPGATFPTVIQNSVDNTLGRIDFAASTSTAAGAASPRRSSGTTASATGTFTLATIRFRAIAPTGAGGTPLTFVFGAGRNTNITRAGTSVFGGATDGSVTIGSLTATPTTGTPVASPTNPTVAPPTATRTPTPTSGIPAGPIGGRGFGLSQSPAGTLLTWQGGTGQDGYTIQRFGAMPALLPTDGPLPATATAFLDTATIGSLGQPFCYVLQPFGSAGAFASDLLCTLANTRSAVRVPQDFTIRLNQSSTASFTWNPPPGGDQTGYVLFPLGEQGGTSKAVALPATATSASHGMHGPTCYVLGVLVGNTIQGHSDIVCGVPGFGTIP